MHQLDADFLKISHLEARMRGETDRKFNISQPIKNEKNTNEQDFFNMPTIDIMHYETSSSNGVRIKRKGGFSGKENNHDSLNESESQSIKNNLGSDKNFFPVKKKIKSEIEAPFNLIGRSLIEEVKNKFPNEIKENNMFLMNEFSQNSRNSICSLAKEKKEKELNEENKSLKAKLEALKLEFETYKGNQNLIKSNLLIELEELRKNEEKSRLFEMKRKLGEFKKKRVGVKFNDIWEDGQMILECKEKLENINKKIDEKQIKSYPNSLSALILEKEKTQVEKTLEDLEKEKLFYQTELLRVAEEENSYFVKNPSLYSNFRYPLLKKRYQILSFIGRGGFSDVFRGYDLESMNEIAIKVHYINPSWTEEMKATYLKHSIRESEVHKLLNHPNIVRLYDTIPLEGDSFCSILEYCDGFDLGLYLRKCKTLPENEAKVIIYEILKGIKYLHEDFDSNARIIHYDLKPQNILFHKGCLKITDFGLCKIMDICQNQGNIELTFKGGGTYWYLPPECFENGFSKINQKVDIWSLGVIFYELIYGKKPFGNHMSQEKIVREKIIINEGDNVDFPANPTLSNAGKNFIRRCLAYKEENRWDVKMAINFEYFF